MIYLKGTFEVLKKKFLTLIQSQSILFTFTLNCSPLFTTLHTHPQKENFYRSTLCINEKNENSVKTLTYNISEIKKYHLNSICLRKNSVKASLRKAKLFFPLFPFIFFLRKLIKINFQGDNPEIPLIYEI